MPSMIRVFIVIQVRNFRQFSLLIPCTGIYHKNINFRSIRSPMQNNEIDFVVVSPGFPDIFSGKNRQIDWLGIRIWCEVTLVVLPVL